MRIISCGLLLLLVFGLCDGRDKAMESSSESDIDEYDAQEEEDIDFLESAHPKNVEQITVCSSDDKENYCQCQQSSPPSLLCKRKGDEYRKPLKTANVVPADKNFKPSYVSFFENHLDYLDAETLLPGFQTDVIALDFMSNHLRRIDGDAFSKFGKLKKLRLTNNFLTLTEETDEWISEGLGGTLEKLYFGYNEIEKINDNVFEPLHNLKTLVLDGNPGIVLTENTFSKGLGRLEKLSLDSCNLKSLPDNIFSNLKNLKYLSLIGNTLTAVPKALNLINNLQILDLSSTNLPEFTPQALKDDHSVQQLFLQNMRFLYELDDCAFCGLTNLVRVDLSGSKKLHTIHPNAFGNVNNTDQSPKNLKSLKLENCTIADLSEELVDWKKLNETAIWDNPLNCDKGLYWLLKNLPDYKLNTLKNAKEPICATPDNFKGQSIANVSKSLGFNWETSSASSFSLFRAFLAFVFVATIAGVFIFGIMFCNKRYGGSGNPFYRPQMPHVGFNNLSADVDFDDENEEQDDFNAPPPVAV
ncbi:hypothetical protein M3Y94_00318800 [Aphelenchoides besseyi]|nr:hypothetical protein M3Y94_00318800 [Aphelenchoides besseyi]